MAKFSVLGTPQPRNKHGNMRELTFVKVEPAYIARQHLFTQSEVMRQRVLDHLVDKTRIDGVSNIGSC